MTSMHPEEPTTASFTPTKEIAPEPKIDPHHLGAHITEAGVAFSVYAHQATAVELCLVTPDSDNNYRENRYRLRGPENGIWHGHIPGIRPGQIYGYRAYGPWNPDAGLFYNPQKILLDPYAKAITGTPHLGPRLYAHQVNDDLRPATHELKPDPLDSLPDAALGVVVNTNAFPVNDRPHTPWRNTVIYEAHVKGFTRTLPGIPPELQGTYAGLAHPVAIQYLRDLGVTAIELLPIHAKFTEPFLQQRGAVNYWGYSTLSYFAPEPSYATERAQSLGPQAVLDEVRGMVSLLHLAGIEVILDVVYNHTAEGGLHGTTLSLRGLDPQRYYVWNHGCPNQMVDYTGCGNSMDFTSTQVVGLMMDSLRYWAGEVGIDGFRFDLGVTLGRNRDQYAVRHPSFVGMATDPILAGCKLIAEPWDIGPNGWQTGNFPTPFADWNDRYRDAIRGFWLTDGSAQMHGRHAHGPHELATRISGSADLFASIVPELDRGPGSSINFVCAHDGFTLADLVSYNHKHNEANGENNRDGSDNNHSWNHEYEGHVLRGRQYSNDPKVVEQVVQVAPLRLRNLRNMWGTLAISAGTPMVLAGDEFGNTQNGNNNAYCVDSPLSWLDWNWLPWQNALHETARYLLQLRAKHPVMRPDCFASGTPVQGDKLADLSWYDRDGIPLTPGAWHDPRNRVMQMLRSGTPWNDVDLLVMINGTMDQVEINPPVARSRVFNLMWDSSWPNPTTRSEESPDSLGVSGYDIDLADSLAPTGTEGDSASGGGLAAEVGLVPGAGVDLTGPATELPVTVRGMTSKMSAMSMRIFFAEIPDSHCEDSQIDLLNVLGKLRNRA